MSELLIRRRVLAEEDGLENTRWQQRRSGILLYSIFCPHCCFSKTKTFQKNLYFFLLFLARASEMTEEQLLSEARQSLPQEAELSFSVDLPTPEAQKVRDHPDLYLLSVFITKCDTVPCSTHICLLQAFWQLWLRQHSAFIVPVLHPIGISLLFSP